MAAMDSLLVISQGFLTELFFFILRCDRTGGGEVFSVCPAKQEVSMDFHKDFYNIMMSAQNYLKEKEEVPWSSGCYIHVFQSTAI